MCDVCAREKAVLDASKARDKAIIAAHNARVDHVDQLLLPFPAQLTEAQLRANTWAFVCQMQSVPDDQRAKVVESIVKSMLFLTIIHH